MSQSSNDLELVEWTPVKNTNGETIANVVTVRLPIPPELIQRLNTIEPPRGDLSTSEYWLQSNLVAKIGSVEIQSFGRAFQQNHPLDRRTHFLATFTISTPIADQKFETEERRLVLSREKLEKVRSEFRCSYEILKRNERATIILRTARQIAVEAVRVGNFTSNRSSRYVGCFRGNIHPSASTKEQNILIKLDGIDDWIPLKRELPFVNNPNGENEE